MYAINGYIKARSDPEVRLKDFLKESFLSRDCIETILKHKMELLRSLMQENFVVLGIPFLPLFKAIINS